VPGVLRKAVEDIEARGVPCLLPHVRDVAEAPVRTRGGVVRRVEVEMKANLVVDRMLVLATVTPNVEAVAQSIDE
jgi:hypothetical protein